MACSLRYLLRRSPLSSSFATRIVGVRAQAIISSRRGGRAASPYHTACPPFGPLLWQITKEQLSEQRHKDVYGTYKRILALPPEQPSGAGTSQPAIDTGGASTSRFCKRVSDRQGCSGLFFASGKAHRGLGCAARNACTEAPLY